MNQDNTTILEAPVESTEAATPRHPLGSRAKILLTSVFGPYAQDDEYGSRAINPMELYHNQVTRVQGPFSLRMFHRSWGLMIIQANISARCTCLDFPVRERFIQEIRDTQYDVIGITAIRPNIEKVREMCRLIRQYQPQATIVVGGHISGSNDLTDRADIDYVVRGDGIRWFRRYLGEDEDQPIRHPEIWSGFGQRAMGFNVPFAPSDVAATLIPSVGCPMGCNFCSTSAMFGGKGKVVSFYETGDELFDIMCQLEANMKTRSFFIMDENFLLHRKRALRLLELMRQHGKGWSNYVFSSANALRSYTMEQLVGLGISWVWMGLEGKNSQYGKLDDADTHVLVRQLQSHGVRVLGSTIIGLEEHTAENIGEAIDHAVSHDTEFHQFMLYTPVPGTPLHAELTAAGVMIPTDELADADVHGQYRFNYRHSSIRPGDETEMLLRAFGRDFDVNGPSILRIVRTTLAGWRRYHNDPEARLRERFGWEAKSLPTTMAGALSAAARWFKNNPVV
ncbi:MAG: cobalamin-dependent protein, partial [Planctomycetota bacterium]